MRSILLLAALFSFSAGAYLTPLNAGTPEGTSVKSTGATLGQLLTAQGDGTSAWNSRVESYTGLIASAADGTYTIDLYAAYPGTFNTFKVITDSGTTTVAVKINGTSVTGMSAVSVSSSIATAVATAANTFIAGDKISLVLSSSASPMNLAFTLKYTR